MLILADAILPRSLDDIGGRETPTRLRLIAAGEKMLGEEGFKGAALHRIAHAAGQKNKYAIQYHFGDLEGLVDAIFALRLKWVEQRRRDLFECARERGLLDSLPALLETLLLPMAEQVDDEGRHSYARFWLQHMARPLRPDDAHAQTRRRRGPVEYVHVEIARMLELDTETVALRMHLIGSMIYWALIDRDNGHAMGLPVPTLDVTLVGIIAVMETALHAPHWPPLAMA
jgi:AcrR family transcriptional regulator